MGTIADTIKSARAPERQSARAPERQSARAPERQSARAPERQSARAPERQSARAPERQSARAPERQSARAPERLTASRTLASPSGSSHLQHSEPGRRHARLSGHVDSVRRHARYRRARHLPRNSAIAEGACRCLRAASLSSNCSATDQAAPHPQIILSGLSERRALESARSTPPSCLTAFVATANSPERRRLPIEALPRPTRSLDR